MRLPSKVGLLSLAVTGGLVAAISPGASAAATPTVAPVAAARTADAAPGSDELSNALETKRRALRETALTGVLKGTAKAQRINGSTVVKVGKQAAAAASAAASSRASLAPPDTGAQDQYVELSREGTDRIFVVLAEFGDKRDPRYPDQDTNPTIPGPTKFDGPLHNNIPAPNRALDNSTVWQADYSAAHYRDIYFGTDANTESLKEYYETQSSGRYSVSGEVTDWVKVPYNEARYGRSNDPNEGGAGDNPNICGSQVCANSQELVVDAVNAWAAGQAKLGRTKAQITTELKTFDVQDRYDYDGDGDFNEPDGYIDHFQVVHAGGDQSDGDPIQGEDANWAHRWYVHGQDQGAVGPAQNKLGGTQIGDTGLWVGDYTMQPENGGVSVFTHEFGHDLGLPDHYDTAGGDNGVEYWNLMAQSRLNAAGEALGTRAGDLSAWDKLQLGWLDYDTVVADQKKTVELGPHEYNSAKPQAIVSVLPDKKVVTELGAPFAGTKQFWSGSGDDLANTATATVDLSKAKSSALLSMKARYDIEADYDYLYVQASTDGGKNWAYLNGTVAGKPFPKDGSGNPALTGAQATWADVSVPLTAYKGKKPLVRLLYRTDGGLALRGFFADDLKLTVDGKVVGTDGAETVTPLLTLGGFTRQGSSFTALYDNFYIASNRSYVSFDKYLKTGPYNFGFANTRPDFVEHFSYEQGLLISYWDTSYADNNTSEHPGGGLVLPIDAHPAARYNLQGAAWRSRIQVYDAPFSLTKGGSFTLHINGQANYVRGLAAEPVFDDSRSYWDPATEQSSVIVPKAGVRMEVTEQNGTSMTVALS